jgi:ABC-2 type transport system ATP-binding protein
MDGERPPAPARRPEEVQVVIQERDRQAARDALQAQDGLPAAIEVRGLHRAYGENEVLRGLDLTVRSGGVTALLGANGAGKTTLVRVLVGLDRADAGTVRVLGENPAEAPRGWRQRVGVVLQATALPEELQVRELLDCWAGYYERPLETADVLGLVGLQGLARRRVGALSGGELRRLDVGLALVGRPELVFLDEPTTGFDPTARRNAWEVLAGLRDLGTTILLTTHYMEEAEVLADDVAVVGRGQVVAHGTTSEVVGRKASVIAFSTTPAATLQLADLGLPVRSCGRRLELAADDPVDQLGQLLAWHRETGAPLDRLEVRPASLEDVFLELTREVQP